jgi:hypothetical protein
MRQPPRLRKKPSTLHRNRRAVSAISVLVRSSFSSTAVYWREFVVAAFKYVRPKSTIEGMRVTLGRTAERLTFERAAQGAAKRTLTTGSSGSRGLIGSR